MLGGGDRNWDQKQIWERRDHVKESQKGLSGGIYCGGTRKK